MQIVKNGILHRIFTQVPVNMEGGRHFANGVIMMLELSEDGETMIVDIKRTEPDYFDKEQERKMRLLLGDKLYDWLDKKSHGKDNPYQDKRRKRTRRKS